jgi:hypothetical protein
MAFTYTAAKYNVAGSMRETYYSGCAANSGDTFVVGMNTVKKVTCDPPTTATDLTVTIANATPIPGQCTLTFTNTGGAAFTGLNVLVAGT